MSDLPIFEIDTEKAESHTVTKLIGNKKKKNQTLLVLTNFCVKATIHHAFLYKLPKVTQLDQNIFH